MSSALKHPRESATEPLDTHCGRVRTSSVLGENSSASSKHPRLDLTPSLPTATRSKSSASGRTSPRPLSLAPSSRSSLNRQRKASPTTALSLPVAFPSSSPIAFPCSEDVPMEVDVADISTFPDTIPFAVLPHCPSTVLLADLRRTRSQSGLLSPAPEHLRQLSVTPVKSTSTGPPSLDEICKISAVSSRPGIIRSSSAPNLPIVTRSRSNSRSRGSPTSTTTTTARKGTRPKSKRAQAELAFMMSMYRCIELRMASRDISDEMHVQDSLLMARISLHLIENGFSPLLFLKKEASSPNSSPLDADHVKAVEEMETDLDFLIDAHSAPLPVKQVISLNDEPCLAVLAPQPVEQVVSAPSAPNTLTAAQLNAALIIRHRERSSRQSLARHAAVGKAVARSGGAHGKRALVRTPSPLVVAPHEPEVVFLGEEMGILGEFGVVVVSR